MDILSKSLFSSKTFWANLLAPVFVWLAAKYGLQVDPDTQAALVGGVMSVANIILRVFTSQPVHVTTPVVGTAAVVSKSGRVGLLVAFALALVALLYSSVARADPCSDFVNRYSQATKAEIAAHCPNGKPEIAAQAAPAAAATAPVITTLSPVTTATPAVPAASTDPISQFIGTLEAKYQAIVTWFNTKQTADLALATTDATNPPFGLSKDKISLQCYPAIPTAFVEVQNMLAQAVPSNINLGLPDGSGVWMIHQRAVDVARALNLAKASVSSIPQQLDAIYQDFVSACGGMLVRDRDFFAQLGLDLTKLGLSVAPVTSGIQGVVNDVTSAGSALGLPTLRKAPEQAPAQKR